MNSPGQNVTQGQAQAMADLLGLFNARGSISVSESGWATITLDNGYEWLIREDGHAVGFNEPKEPA